MKNRRLISPLALGSGTRHDPSTCFPDAPAAHRGHDASLLGSIAQPDYRKVALV